MATKKELVAEAKALGISGSSRMSKDELEAAIAGAAEAEATLDPDPESDAPQPDDSAYTDLLALRVAADEADAAVEDAWRSLSRARANQADFAQRDRDIADAKAVYQGALKDAQDARLAFEKAKAGS